ncbi:hypothetical protein GCM10027277_29520 [Pseudoduganella ginsengisoli]|nr:transporter [Pseudoduganella ginsengisoli]
MHTWKTTAAAIVAACVATQPAAAADNFQLRYNLAGNLGGELFAARDQVGWAGGLALTAMENSRVTGDNGLALTRTIPGGTVPLPNTPSALYPAYSASVAQVAGTGTQKQANLGLAYITEEHYGGGRLAFLLNVPFAKKTQRFEAMAATPALNWSPAIPAPVRAAVTASFNRQYQAQIGIQAGESSGETTGMGDVEVQAGWRYVQDQLRVLAGASVVLPTGKYSAAAGPDTGYGNYTTFRPAVQATWLPVAGVALSGKVTWAVNTRNRDNDVRSGNWAGLELAAGYQTSLGVLGLNGLRVQQYQADSGNPWGSGKLRSTNAGVFYTVRLEPVNAAMTLQYMATTASRNARHGNFSQLRITKFF